MVAELSRTAPYPADTRAKGWRFELDYEQIEQSDTWDLAGEIPLAQHCLLMMWMVAWTQLPCGSLPNDEAVIKAKCKIPAPTWAKCRAVLMRGWWLADDGRLYHDTLAQRVLEMMKRRRSDSDRKAQERMRKASESQANPQGVTAESRVTPAGLQPESSTDNRLPTTEEEKDKPPARKRAAAPTVPPDDLVAAGFDASTAAEFIAHKQRLEAPLTPRAWADHLREAQKAGMTPQAAAEKVMAKGWKGFDASYVAGRQAQPQRQNGHEAEPEWRREQRERNEAALGPYAAKRRTTTVNMEAPDGPAFLVG